MKDIQTPPRLPLPYSQQPKAGEVVSTRTMSHIMSPVSDAYTQDMMQDAFAHAQENHDDGREVLFQQTHIMHYLFNRLLEKGIGGESYNGKPLPQKINENFMMLALRTQHQCRQTIDSIRHIDSVEDETVDNPLIAGQTEERTE